MKPNREKPVAISDPEYDQESGGLFAVLVLLLFMPVVDVVLLCWAKIFPPQFQKHKPKEQHDRKH